LLATPYYLAGDWFCPDSPESVGPGGVWAGASGATCRGFCGWPFVETGLGLLAESELGGWTAIGSGGGRYKGPLSPQPDKKNKTWHKAIKRVAEIMGLSLRLIF